MESPRKGRKWTLTTNGSPEQQEKEQPNQPRGFRLLSPKKALELKKQAKARKQEEKKLKQHEETDGGGSGGMMPIWEKAPRGASPAKRTGITLRSEVLNTIEDPSEDGSAASVGVDEIFGTERTRGDLNRSSDGCMQWTSPPRTQSAPQQARTKPHHAPRRSLSEETDFMNAASCSQNKSENLADICFVPPAGPSARSCSDSMAERRRPPTARTFRAPERQRSHGRGDQCGQPVLIPPSSPTQANKFRGQYTKPPRVDDFQQSLHLMEVFDDVEEESMVSENEEYDPIHAQEEEMMAMAMEQSVREMTAPESPRAVRTASRVARYPDVEKSMLKKQDWQSEKYMYTVKAKKSVVRPSRNMGTADAEAIRIAEEEQEKEMIQLAMERSLAEAPMQKVLRSTTNKVHARGRRPQRYGQQDGRTTAGPPAPIDEDEIARREQEMIRRALEMSRNDF